MIIGFDGSRAFGGERTGTENYSYNLLRSLAAIDTKNEYVVYVRSGAGPTFAKATAGKGNFRFVEIPLLRFWTQVGLAYRTWVDKLDLLFVPAHTLPVLRRPGLSTVVTIHDLGYEFLPQYHQFPHKIYLNWSTEYAVKTATKIIAVSNATKKDLINKLHCQEKKIEVIYEGVEIERFQKKYCEEEVVAVMKKYGVEKPYILSVGTIQPRKNYQRLIEAFDNLRSKIKDQKSKPQFKDKNFKIDNMQLVIIGKRGWMWKEILELPKKLGIESKVKFLGHVSDLDLPIFYQNAECLVIPSLYEGFGLPVLEAMASGCPVVASKTSSLPEVVGEAGILINPYDTESIVGGIIKALEFSIFNFQFSINNQFSISKINKNDKNYSKMIERGYERAREFSWERAARETLRVFEETSKSK